MLALTVPSHRPPFRKDHHITGQNLFVSAYHGFSQLGSEHIPVPRAYEELPIFTCDYDSVCVESGTGLSIKLKTVIYDSADPTKYRVAVRIQLTRPGAGRQPGYLRSFIASGNCTASECFVEIHVPDYREIWKLDLPAYQVHMRYFLIDSETGYRNIFKKKSFLMTL